MAKSRLKEKDCLSPLYRMELYKLFSSDLILEQLSPGNKSLR